MSTERIRVDAEKLRLFSTKALQKVGVPKEDAETTAGILLTTDLRGVDTHGVAHLARYVERIKMGHINPKPQIKIVSQTPSAASVDGDFGLGFVVGHRAMTEAMDRAEKTGVGSTAVRNSTHYGASACYAMMALEHDMIGIAMTTANNQPLVVAPGSREPATGANPLALAAPAGKKAPFVLDMAASVIANSKLEMAIREGRSIPEGWVIDKDGKPVTDPTKRVIGVGGILPLGGTPELGGYKGFGLAVLQDILCGVLSGSSASILWEKAPKTREELRRGGYTSCHFFMALRIESFLPVENFKRSMDEMIAAFEALPTLPGFKAIKVAGGYEAEIEEDRRANGIPLHFRVVEGLQKLAKDVGIEYDL